MDYRAYYKLFIISTLIVDNRECLFPYSEKAAIYKFNNFCISTNINNRKGCLKIKQNPLISHFIPCLVIVRYFPEFN